MKKVCQDHQLIDLTFQTKGTDNFSTYQRGSNHIDYILCDYHIARALTMGCYEPFQYHIKWDHHMMAFDFHHSPFWEHDTPTTHIEGSNPQTGKLSGSNITAKHEYLVNHKYEKRLQDLQTKWNPKEAELLDWDFQ